MEKKETLEAFYADKFNQKVTEADNGELRFGIFSFNACMEQSSIKYRRRDFFKVTFTKGNSTIHYSDKSLEVSGSALVFFNPDVPYTIDMADGVTGHYFIFKEDYLNAYFRRNIRDLPLFAAGHDPLYLLNKSQDKVVEKLYQKMQRELESDYPYKHDLIRNCILELMHFAMKLQPVQIHDHQMGANKRLTAVFSELLDRQFPVDPKNRRLEMRSAGDYAKKLYVHVNHLNHVLKLTTGKSTTVHISEKIVNEAKILLKHSHYNISEISYSFGFDDPAHFNHFFKKQTGQAPSAFRV